jgi:NAD-dependent dihydropyrimidine dehydrogenase PreA subunit
MELVYLKNVSTLQLDSTRCVGCGLCLTVCPHGVFMFEKDSTAKRAVLVNKDACMECGACAMNCPTEAVTVRAGVGCAWAIAKGLLTGTEPTCGCSEGATGKAGSTCCG